MHIDQSRRHFALKDRTPISEYRNVSDGDMEPAAIDDLHDRIHREFIAGKDLLIIRDLADAGDAHAQHRVAAMYRIGHGTERNPKIAEHYLCASAENGHAPAQLDYFDSYYRGSEVATDAKVAENYLSRAIEQGHGPACYRMGEIYELGIGGMPPDIAKASYFYSLASVHPK